MNDPQSTRNLLQIQLAGMDTGHPVVVVSGRLDAVSATELAEALLEVETAAQLQVLTIDLAGVDFVDSAGLAVLVRARRRSRTTGISLVLVKPRSDAAMRVFRLTQFDQVFTMVDARED